MGQALYRKYRTTSLADTPGQEHITTALQHALDTGRISHAYLFTGPRGVGKTSIARILAYAINDIPYSTEPHLDIIEIDAASNRRIDEIRDLRDKVHIAPASAKYKVYIIDEVHMLTREAFNALLKTLEEPPAHVVFILATTDAHKLPETIVSRTQRYHFRPITPQVVVDRLKFIAKEEQIKIDDEALQLLAVHGGGSFRDSISLLDQLGNHGAPVDADAVRLHLGIPPTEAIIGLLKTLASGDLSEPVKALQTLYDQGYRAVSIAEQVSEQLRNQLASGKQQLGSAETLQLLKQLLDTASSAHPERALELILMQSMTPTIAPQPVVSTPAPAPKPKPVSQPPAAKPTEPEPMPEPTPEPVKAAPKPRAPHGDKPLDDALWAEVLAELKKQYNTVYGIVRMAQTDFSEPGEVRLAFAFAFHQKRINDPKNRKIISDIIQDLTGQQFDLKATHEKDAKPAKVLPATDVLQDISSVFGGGELL